MRYNNKQNDKLNISNGDATQTTEIGVATSAASSGKDEKDIIWLNVLTADISKDTYNDFLNNVNELDSRHSMFAETIFAIISDVNEEKLRHGRRHIL